MHSLFGIHLLNIALWIASVTCLIVGTSGDQPDQVAIATQSWGLLLSAGAAAATVWISVERLVQVVSRRNAQETATAVGVAVGQVLAERSRL